MPIYQLKNKNEGVKPWEIDLPDDGAAQRLANAWADSGWSLAANSDDQAAAVAAPVRPRTPVVTPDPSKEN